MMPRRYTADEINRLPGTHNYFQHVDGRWLPCRFLYWSAPFWDRFILAWGVFTGKYDALDWEEQVGHEQTGAKAKDAGR